MGHETPVAQPLDARSRSLRHRVVDGLEGGERGHVGSALSLVEILRVLFDDIMTYRVEDPRWGQRDRLILSKGHGCMALYALLADKGFISQDQLTSFCRFDSDLGGHPEFGRVCGIEASTGSLGHGLSVGIGMAIAARIRSEAHRIFVVVGDGELDEGSVWEAALAAGHHRLDSLTVIVDFNSMQSYSSLSEVWNLEPLIEKWEAFGFEAHRVDGHSIRELKTVLTAPPNGRPRAVIAETIKGKGLSFAEQNPMWHHKSKLTAEEVAMMREALDNA